VWARHGAAKSPIMAHPGTRGPPGGTGVALAGGTGLAVAGGTGGALAGGTGAAGWAVPGRMTLVTAVTAPPQ
jgi:hypothetical protein